jgi:hypothetical protein
MPLYFISKATIMSASSLLSDLLVNPKFNKQFDWSQQYPEWFVYNLDFGVTTLSTLATGLSVSQNIQIQSDASFLLTGFNGSLFNANTQSAQFGNTQAFNVTINIQDTGSGKNLSSSPVQFAHLFGQNGENAYELPVPRILSQNSTIVITLTNNTGTALTGAMVSCHGVKILNRR